MALPASVFGFELEDTVIESVARLEANVEHIREDVADIKSDIRRLDDKVDKLDQKLSGKSDALFQAVADLRVGRALDRVWWLLMSGALLAIMARAFKWL